jgi:hypothetical protein
MPVPSDTWRLDPEKYRGLLDRVYEAAPGPPGAAVTLSLVQEQFGRLMALYEQFIHIPKVAGGGYGSSTIVRRRLQRTFRGWHKRALAFGVRLDGYWEDACLPSSPCPDAIQPEHTTEWVAAPLLDGVWPDTYYLGFTTPDRPDAIELAQLWNQLIAVHDVLVAIGDSPDQVVAEWLDVLEVELRTSLPGEPATWRDDVDGALAVAAEGLGDVWEAAKSAALWVGGAAAFVLVAVVVYKART